jgi:hypothetical protein
MPKIVFCNIFSKATKHKKKKDKRKKKSFPQKNFLCNIFYANKRNLSSLRDVNCVAYFFAKVASSQPICFSYNSTNLSPSIREAWIKDLLVMSS